MSIKAPKFWQKIIHTKLTLFLLGGILLVAAFLRLYRISDYMTFLGDEGRDVLVAKGILEGDFTLLGPRASAGDFFLGPIYYYMMAPFLWLFRLDPVGPAIMVALVGVATVFLVYVMGQKLFSRTVGLFAAALYAVSPVVITYSHSSWNPNVLPFFSLLTVFLLYKAIAEKFGWKYFLSIGVLLGIALQLHYLALFLIIEVGLFILVGKLLTEKKHHATAIVKNYLVVFGGFLIGFSPFIAFEIRHGFPNTQTIIKFIFSDTMQKTYETQASFFTTISDVFFRIFGHLLFNYPLNTATGFELQLWQVTIVLLAIAAIAKLLFQKNKLIIALFFIWLFASVFFFGFYKKEIYDYYFAFIFPLPFLLMANLFADGSWVVKNKQYKLFSKITGFVLFGCVLAINLLDYPFQYPPNRQMNQMRTIAEFVLSKTEGKPFNFALISGGNSDHAYRYFFEIEGNKPVTIENTLVDPERKSVTGQLLIVCEDTSCQPLGHSLFEVAGFGRAEIAGEWEVYQSIAKVYKLVPYKEKK